MNIPKIAPVAPTITAQKPVATDQTSATMEFTVDAPAGDATQEATVIKSITLSGKDTGDLVLDKAGGTATITGLTANTDYTD